MSAREWKPGDVALVSSWRGTDQIGLRVRPRVVEDPLTWCALDESGDTRGLSDDEVTSTRPLVVIDPEDREQVERLCEHWFDGDDPGEQSVTDMQAALRSLITPPKPEEPTARGAVVKDSSGLEWVRVHPGGKAWVNGYQRWASWGELLDFGIAEVVRP